MEYEVAFRALPEHELRVAGVALISAARVAGIDPDDSLHGAPDLVIEVLPPSNTTAGIRQREALPGERGQGILGRRSGPAAGVGLDS